jgi:hypothetical protein
MDSTVKKNASLVETLRRFWTFGHTYGWRRNCYRLGVVLCRLLSGKVCQMAAAEIMAASVTNLRRVERLPRILQVRLAGASDLSQVSRFVQPAERASQRLENGDQCVIALSEGRIVATEWFKVGPAVYDEDRDGLGVVFRVPQGACWLYDGVSGEDGQARGPWGAVMGRLRRYLEERGLDTAYFQVGYENPYSVACHESLGFHVIGCLWFLRCGWWRLVLYRSPSGAWTRLREGTLELLLLSQESHTNAEPALVG